MWKAFSADLHDFGEAVFEFVPIYAATGFALIVENPGFAGLCIGNYSCAEMQVFNSQMFRKDINTLLAVGAVGLSQKPAFRYLCRGALCAGC